MSFQSEKQAGGFGRRLREGDGAVRGREEGDVVSPHPPATRHFGVAREDFALDPGRRSPV